MLGSNVGLSFSVVGGTFESLFLSVFVFGSVPGSFGSVLGSFGSVLGSFGSVLGSFGSVLGSFGSTPGSSLIFVFVMS
ncbi:hypothetical protein [Bacillus sp. JJ783]|uniref:hypothetical protein n=1 Tax=Bacillus sp. JJ783 TaxID=3122974 RepID=UPI0030000D0C